MISSLYSEGAPLQFRLRCADCGSVHLRQDWSAKFQCPDCFSRAGRTDPEQVVGYWDGCRRMPNRDIGTDSYWRGYERALRTRFSGTRFGGGVIDLAMDLVKFFPEVDEIDAAAKYAAQKKKASERSIAWEFDVCSWMLIWLESGCWHMRGSGKYVMARDGDVGPYSPSNVYITTAANNTKDAWTNKPSGVRKKRPVGYGRGWSYRPDKNKSKPYAVVVAGSRIGDFASAAEAEAAYHVAAQAISFSRSQEAA